MTAGTPPRESDLSQLLTAMLCITPNERQLSRKSMDRCDDYGRRDPVNMV